jgi:anion-transporting  ArsA/GET3 family ATPase
VNERLASALAEKRIVVVSGAGGVGKTTLSAALAVALAAQGHRTVVLTVDPARRLANALGFERFSDELTRVAAAKGELWASMLDARRYFDKVIERFAGSEEQRQRVTEHPLWRLTLDYLGGTQEYAAMERILEFAGDARWDRIVVDTPPTQNALDLFAAPERLASFMESSVIRWFREGDGGGLFARGGKLALGLLEKVLGGEFLGRLSDFLKQLGGMESGFRDRHRAVMELLRGPEAAFVLVSSATDSRLAESLAFAEAVGAHGVGLEAVVLNRVDVPPASPSALAGDGPAYDEARRLLRFLEEAHREQQRVVDAFRATFPAVTLRIVERSDSPVHEVGALETLGDKLLATR